MWYPGQQHDHCDDGARHFGVKNTFIHYEIPDNEIDDDGSLGTGGLKRQHSEPPPSSPHKQHLNSQPIWRSPKVSPASSGCEENTNDNGSDLESDDEFPGTDSEREFCQQETEGHWPMYHPSGFNGQFHEVDLLSQLPPPPPPPPIADNLADFAYPPGNLGISNAMQFMVVPNPAIGMPMDSSEVIRKNPMPKGTGFFDGTRLLDRPRNSAPQRGHAQVTTKHLTPKFCGDCGGSTEPHYKFCLFCGTSFMVHQWE